MVFRRFSWQLAARLVVLGLLTVFTSWLVVLPGYVSASILAGAILAMAAAELWIFVGRTNRELTRYLDSARHADYSQRFEFDEVGAGFTELGAAFAEILERMQNVRSNQELEVRRLRELIEHIPVPLLSVHGDDAITLQNNAARRLFGAAHVARLWDLNQFGSRFREAVDEAVPGQRELVNFSVDGVDYHLAMAATELVAGGARERLISLQDIQTELDVTEAQAWQDLVRVLNRLEVDSSRGDKHGADYANSGRNPYRLSYRFTRHGARPFYGYWLEQRNNRSTAQRHSRRESPTWFLRESQD